MKHLNSCEFKQSNFQNNLGQLKVIKLIAITVLRKGALKRLFREEDSNSQEPVDPGSASKTEANEDSNSQEPVDTYPDLGSANNKIK